MGVRRAAGGSGPGERVNRASRVRGGALVFPLRLAAVFLLPLFSSCSWMRPSLQTEQASDLVTSTGVVAVTAVRATVLSIPRQPVTTLRVGGAVLINRPQASLEGNTPLARRFRNPRPETPGARDFEELLNRRGLPRPERGSLSWLVDGKNFFPELSRQIESARRSIDIQVFIFDNDSVGVRVAEQLKTRAGEVAVRVLFDGMGTSVAHLVAPDTPPPHGFIPPADMGLFLGSGTGVRFRRILTPWLVSDHTKLLVFDQKTAILGGMNIGQEYHGEWHDLMARVEGPVVTSLARNFNRTWRKNGVIGDLALLRKPARLSAARASEPQDIPLRVLRTDPAEGRDEIHDALMLAIRAAKRRIWVQTPYLCHANIIGALAKAAERGVQVRVILPGSGDSVIMHAANYSAAADLIAAGVEVYRYPGMTHAKVAICDGWATFGSANLDTLSMKINRELNLAFSDPATVRSLEKEVFDLDFPVCKRLRAEDVGGFGRRLVRVLADQL